MKVIICCSISVADVALEIKTKLENQGHTVTIPEGVRNKELQSDTEIETTEKAEEKINQDLIRAYYEKIKLNDVVLIVNPDKQNIKGYIGGNTFLEMAFAHVLNKKLFVLYPLPNMPYSSEMIAMQPIILNGDINKLV